MIGLEYILGLYNMQHILLADELDIKKQNINLWIKNKQNIPKKYLPQLEEIFDIPQEYFQKELTEDDKIEIQSQKIKNDSIAKEFGIDNASDISQIKYILENYDKEKAIDILKYNKNYLKIYMRMKRMDVTVQLAKIQSYIDKLSNGDVHIMIDNNVEPYSLEVDRIIDIYLALDEIINNFINWEG